MTPNQLFNTRLPSPVLNRGLPSSFGRRPVSASKKSSLALDMVQQNQQRQEALLSSRSRPMSASGRPARYMASVKSQASRRAIFIGAVDPYTLATIVTEAKEVSVSKQHLDIIVTGFERSEQKLMLAAITIQQILLSSGIDITNVNFYNGGFAPTKISSVPQVDNAELLLKPDGSMCQVDLLRGITEELNKKSSQESRTAYFQEALNSGWPGNPLRLEPLEWLGSRWAKEPVLDFQVAGPFTALAKLASLAPDLKTKKGTVVALACSWVRDNQSPLLVPNFNTQADPEAFNMFFHAATCPFPRVDYTLIPTDPHIPGATW